MEEDRVAHEGHETELWLSGSKASRHGWVRVSDATERVFYHSIESGKITLERPVDFGDDNPAWADGTELHVYRGKCSRCKDFVPRSEAGPVTFAADHGQEALSFLLCRPCLNWLVESVKLEREGKPPLAPAPPPPPAQKPVFGRAGDSGGSVLGKGGKARIEPLAPARSPNKQLMKVYKDVVLRGAGEILARSTLARGYAKCMYSCLSEQTLRPGRFDDQRAECLKAKASALLVNATFPRQAAAVVAGEGRRRAAREVQMKLRCISQHKSNGAGDYLCWFSPEGRVDYFGGTRGGRAHGWGLAEYQDGTCSFSHGQQNTPKGGKLSTIVYGSGLRYHGEMKQGKPHGMGTKTWPDESEYVGEFSLGKEHGEGTKTFPDGSEHSGRWRAGNRDGPGVFIDARGKKTVGTFRDDVFSKTEEDGIVAPTKTDITVESGQYDPETLLDLAISCLAEVTDRQPNLNKASFLLKKIPLHLHPLVAASFASTARALSPGFRKALPSFAWRDLSEVRLCNAPLLPADTAKLSFFLEAIPNLTKASKLTVVACKLVGEAVSPVADAIATSQTLQEVDLSWNPLQRGGVRLVVAALETAPQLRRLNVAGCQLGVDGGQAMITAIASGRDTFRLLDLDLAYNSLGAGCGDLLAVSLRRNETLTRLSLRSNGLGPEGGASLAAGLARNCGTLKELVVADNRLGPRIATLVAASMRGGTSQCLRGFGYRRPTDAGRGDNIAAPFAESGADTAARSSSSPKRNLGNCVAGAVPATEPTSAGKRFGGVKGGSSSALRAAVASTRQSSSSLQRTSAIESSPNGSQSSTTIANAGASGGTPGAGKSELHLLSIESAPITPDAVAFEGDLGRPQTAGTASG
ncbi:unnamed protein product [Scytosiphon promiscuus]